VSVQLYKGDSSYHGIRCLSSDTIKEILDSCKLDEQGAQVYLDGRYIPRANRNMSIRELKAQNPAFIIVKYGEVERQR